MVRVKSKIRECKKIYLEKRTYKQIKKLIKDINKNFKTEVVIDSWYRPYLYQENLLKKLLYEKKDDVYKSLALSGHSEHQTGLAVDIVFYKDVIYDNKFKVDDYLEEFKWVQNNCF